MRPFSLSVAVVLLGSLALPTSAADPEKAASLARQILDEGRPAPEREALVRDNPALSAELIRAMVSDLTAGTKEEYRRIPWIWRVAIAAGKRNEANELKRLLDASMPAPGGTLNDWQVVVIGGGLVNGITQAGAWPSERLSAVIQDDANLEARWREVVAKSELMCDDEKVPTGTRYDALRVVGTQPWDRAAGRLLRYLVPGVHPELEMGAVSGLGDVRTPSACVAQAMIAGLGHFQARNRDLALDALLRDEARTNALLDTLADGRIKKDVLGPKRVEALKTHGSAAVRRRASELLTP